jgi:4-hydroxy-4-methyl-2-oxoglutarate aldolase
VNASAKVLSQLQSLGVATIYEASGRRGLIDTELIQVVPGSRVAGPARTVLCGQNDNRAVHACIERIQPGEVLVLAMPAPMPVALVGELLATQAKVRGAAAILLDASIRDLEDLRELGLPIWARWVRATGAGKSERGQLDATVSIGSASIAPGDIVVLDADGAVVVDRSRVDDVLAASIRRRDKEAASRERYEAGELSYDLNGLRAEDMAGGSLPG